jgi:hypothetical protein
MCRDVSGATCVTQFWQYCIGIHGGNECHMSSGTSAMFHAMWHDRIGPCAPGCQQYLGSRTIERFWEIGLMKMVNN